MATVEDRDLSGRWRSTSDKEPRWQRVVEPYRSGKSCDVRTVRSHSPIRLHFCSFHSSSVST